MAGAGSTGRDDLLLVGTIEAAFGLKGQVKLHALTSRPDHLRRVKTVFVGEQQVAFGLRRVVEHKSNVLILTLVGVDDRSTAEALRGAEVSISQSDAAPLDEDEYFLHDLHGLLVETTAGEQVGTVTEVLETGANDVLVVTRPEGGEVLLPMIRDVVKLLDVGARRLVIEPMEGLLDQ